MLSIIIPVYNEEQGIGKTLKDIEETVDGFQKYEIILINDGSTDETIKNVKKIFIKNLSIIEHPENLGYGKSLLDGIRQAKYNCIVIIDGDGSYPAQSIKELYSFFPQYDMIIGARHGKYYEQGLFKRPARMLFNFLVQYVTGTKIPDVNSGLRIFKKDIVMKFTNLLCAGFSFTTTLTLLFYMNLCCVKYVPVSYRKREGKSKVRHFRDTLRALQIIVEAILMFNPLKLFLLLALGNAVFGFLLGLINHMFFQIEYLSYAAAICVASFIPIFGLGLIADQIGKYNKRK